MLQASLRVGNSDSPLEREADEVAGRIVGQGQGPASLAAPAAIARSVSESTGADVGAGRQAGTAPAEALGALEGGGAPLPDSERAYFEPRLGHSFAGVRIHTGAGTGAAATRLGARAFTHGSDVAFAPGEYAPQSERGRRLLAHELVHVVQQSQRATSDVQRDLATPPPVVAPAAQPDLTPEQIQSALRFNQQRFDRDPHPPHPGPGGHRAHRRAGPRTTWWRSPQSRGSTG